MVRSDGAGFGGSWAAVAKSLVVSSLCLVTMAACAGLPSSDDGAFGDRTSGDWSFNGGADGAPSRFLREDGRTSVPLRAESLLGLDGAGLVRPLGKPDAFRREQPAEIWQYSSDGCVLDIVLYQKDGPARVVYMEARSREADALPVERCLARLSHPAAPRTS